MPAIYANLVVDSKHNCCNQAIALKIPSLGSMSDMGILRQLSLLTALQRFQFLNLL
jgi:hypothetical protein